MEAAGRRANPQTGPRVSLVGRLAPTDETRCRDRFLARHPSAERYAGFADFRCFRMTVARAHWVGGFADARWMDAKAYRAEPGVAETLAAAEPGILAHMNADHRQAVALYARVLLNRRGGPWRLTGADCDGIDMRAPRSAARLDFPAPVVDAQALRGRLIALAHDARGRLPAATDP